MSNLVLSSSNLLLESIPEKERRTFLAKCDLVRLTQGGIIYNANDYIEYVYFPVKSIISLVNPVDKNAGMEVALIGNEGMLGITVMLGSDFSPFQALVQNTGDTLRITVKNFLHELQKCPALELKLKRYICVSFSQLVQTTVCNRFHVVEERLARLLLMIKDRTHASQFRITQKLLAQMLGVRRVGVTKAATALKQKKLITYIRGDVDISDVAGLEVVSCSCYKTDKETYTRIFAGE